MNDIKELESVLKTLKELEAGKDIDQYKKDHVIEPLKEYILNKTIDVFIDFVLCGYRFKDSNEEYKTFVEKTHRLINKWSSSTAYKESIKALFDTYDYEAFIERSMSLYYAVKALAYAQYWVAYVKETGISEYPYYNELINMYWWAEKSIWITGDIKDGVFYERMLDGFTTMLPPTLDAIKKEYDTDMQALSVKYGG